MKTKNSIIETACYFLDQDTLDLHLNSLATKAGYSHWTAFFNDSPINWALSLGNVIEILNAQIKNQSN